MKVRNVTNFFFQEIDEDPKNERENDSKTYLEAT